MKRHLVWFESLEAAAPPESGALTTRDIERNQGVVDTLGNDELSRLQRAVILDPTVRITTNARRGRARRNGK